MSNKPVGLEETMQVRLSNLDRLLQLAGEVIIVSSNLNTLSRGLQEGQTVTDGLADDTKDLAITSSRISSDLHDLVVHVRTVDMQDLFSRFRRLARDTARRLGKTIRLELEGEDISIDKTVSESIYDPVAHQLRNAIAHGLEDVATRQGQGKDPVGMVAVRVRNLENATVIEVSDDGAGIDLDAVRRAVVEKDLAPAEAVARMSDDDLYAYLYMPGFSTARSASSTAGRGVGMDVIRSVMDQIGGETRIVSERGKGTTFSFILPLISAVNITDALVVAADRYRFAFPISSVVASQSITPDAITTTTGRGRSILYLGAILPLYDLLEVFGEPPSARPADGAIPVIIVEHKGRRLAYIVSDFMNPQKLVISAFDRSIAVPGLVGTAVLSGRQLCMIIDVPALIAQTLGLSREALSNGSGSAGPERIKAPVSQAALRPAAGADVRPGSADADRPATPGDAEGLDAFGADRPGIEFLREVESMLGRLNKEMLALEEKRDRETTDAVFRLAHSVKGNLTMYGADEPSAVTHGLEALLDQARQGEAELTDAVFDIFFDGLSYLDEAVAALLRGAPPLRAPDTLIAAMDQRLRKADEGAIRPVDIDTAHVQLDTTGEFYLSSRRREGVPLTLCRIDFEPRDQPRFLIAYLILRRIQRVADVIGCLPSLTDIEQGLCEGGIVVLFAARHQEPARIEKLGQNLKRYYGVTRFDAAPYA